MAKDILRSPGQIAVLITVCAVGVGIALTGGGLFSPGKLNARIGGGPPLGGVHSHAELGGKCSACHAPPWSGETMADRCMACHTDIRSQLDAHRPLHGRLPDSMQCRNCHSEHKGEFAALTDLSTFDHDCTAFPLTGQHTVVACAQCHTSGTYKGTSATCVGCHAEPTVHLGMFGTDCARCHSTATWKQASLPVGGTSPAFDHNTTAFPLTGKHTAVACAQCHKDNTFRGTPTTCVSCHAEPTIPTHKFGTDCARCHSTATWSLASLPVSGPGPAFDHSTTAFPLTGKHTAVACAQCHKNNTFRGTPTTCVSCHAEPKIHAGSKLGTDCAKCHSTSTWTGGTLGDFNHVFPITHGGGGKKPKACVMCHKPADQFKTYTCYECHRHDPAKTLKKHIDKGIANIDNCVKCHPQGRKKGAKLTATDLTDAELLVGCPADANGVDSDDIGGGCPHDSSLLHTLCPSPRVERFEQWSSLTARARPPSESAPRPRFNHATLASPAAAPVADARGMFWLRSLTLPAHDYIFSGR